MRTRLLLGAAAWALLALAAGPLVAQQPAPATPPAQPQPPAGGPKAPPGNPPPKPGDKPAEKAPAPKVYQEEVWYRILEKDDPIGYGHFTVSRGVFKGAPVLRVIYEEELRPRKLLDLENSVRLTTTTTSDYEFLEGEIGTVKGEQERRSTLRVAQGRFYLVTASGYFDAPWEATKDATLESMLGKWLVKKGLAEGKSFTFAAFTGLPDPLTDEWQVQVRSHETRTLGDNPIEGWACHAAFKRGEKAVERDYFIDTEGRILEIRDADVSRTYAKSEEAAKAGMRFDLSQRGRRDPFRIAMTPEEKLEGAQKKTPGEIGGAGKPKPAYTTNEIQAMLQEAADSVDRMKAAKKSGQANEKQRDEILAAEYEKVLTNFKLFLDKDRIPKEPDRTSMAKLKAEADTLYSALERYVVQIEKLRDEARDLFESQEYGPVLAKKLEEADQVVRLPELNGTPYLPKIRAAYDETKRYVERGKLRVDFEGKKPKITGIIYHTVPYEVPFRMGLEILGDRIAIESSLRVGASKSSCFLAAANKNEVKVEGEEIAPDVRVKRIDRGAVVFDYLGEEIRVEMGRQP